MSKKIIIPDKTKNDYRLTGIACIALNETAFTVGTRNIAGGHLLKIGAYNPDTRKLTIATGDMGKLAPNMTLYLWTCANDDNSPHELKIVTVDVANRTITLSQNLDIREELLEMASNWIGAVADAQRQDAAFASGDLCFAPGEYSTASGAITLASGFGAQAGGVLCEARGDMSFAIGNMSVASGLVSFASGHGSNATGMFATAEGSATLASGDSSHAEGTGSESAGDSSHAGGFNSRAAGRISFAHGAMAKANADHTIALGYRAIADAKFATVIGKDGELPNSPENEAAFAIAGGEHNIPLNALTSRSRRKVGNPLFGQDGEPEFVNQLGFCLSYRGHLLDYLDERTVNVTSGITAVSLDHDWFGRWRITPTGSGKITFSCDNWENGDRGTLVVVNGANRVVFPASWVWISGNVPLFGQVGGEPATLQSNGYNIIIMFKIENTIFCFPSLRNDGTIDG